MKNLFDFATKELSQDAFLKWLFANYNDPQIRDISRSLLAVLGKRGDVDINSKNIENVKILSQYKKIDIAVEFSADGKDYFLVIEDKTNSNQHSEQLNRYRETICEEFKNTNTQPLFVFYKTDILSENDDAGIEKANEDKTVPEWKVFNIDHIYSFFKEKTNTPSQILNDYSKYIAGLYKAVHFEDGDDIVNWDKRHWEGYALKELSKYNNHKKERYVWIGGYQGRNISLCFQRCLPNDSKDAAVLEIVFRKKVTGHFRHAFFVDDKSKRVWSINKFKDNKEKTELREKLINYIKEKKSLGIVETTRKDATNTFGKYKESFEITNFEETNKKIKEWIKNFDQMISEFKG